MKNKILCATVLCMLLMLACTACASNEPTPTINGSTDETSIETTDEVSTEDAQVPHLAIGETASTDIVELTLNTVQYTNTVSLDHDNWLKPCYGGGLSAGDNKVYIWFEFTVKNLSKQDLSGYDVCTATIDYNDGYIYDGATYTSMAGWSTSQTISNNVGLTNMSPLETENYYGFISCVSEVRTNQDAPLSIVFSLPGDMGVEKFAFDIERSATDADNGVDSEMIDTILACLDSAVDDFDFVRKYAGNVNNKGSRKFADSFVDGLRHSLDDIDLSAIADTLPEAYESLLAIQEHIDSVCDYLVDMGKTNSDANVQKMKDISAESIVLIEKLVSDLVGY